MAHVKTTPDGYGALTPTMTISDEQRTIEFYQKGLGAEQISMMPGPNGKVMHAEFRIGGERFMIGSSGMGGGQSPKELGGTASSVLVYCDDVDAVFKRAVAAGGKALSPPMNMFWGDRWCRVEDPSGHVWQIATHVEDVRPEDMQRRMEEQMRNMPPT